MPYVRECDLKLVIVYGYAIAEVCKNFCEIRTVRHRVMQYKGAIRISQFECAILLDFR